NPRAPKKMSRRSAGLMIAGLVLATCLGGVVFAVSFWKVDIQPIPSSANLKNVTQFLREGKAVQLLPEVGLPKWYEWDAGETKLECAGSNREPLRIGSFTFAILELLKEVPCERYRVKLEMRPQG